MTYVMYITVVTPFMALQTLGTWPVCVQRENTEWNLCFVCEFTLQRWRNERFFYDFKVMQMSAELKFFFLTGSHARFVKPGTVYIVIKCAFNENGAKKETNSGNCTK